MNTFSQDAHLLFDEQSTLIRSMMAYYTVRASRPPAATTTSTSTTDASKPATSKQASTPAKVTSSTTKPHCDDDEDDDDDDDFMTSLSDDDEEEGDNNVVQELLAKKNAEREAAKRAAKGGPQAKSSIILDVKPIEAEQDMNELLKEVKAITMEGLTWGGHEFLPVAYGVNKIRIICVVVDDICSVDVLTEEIESLDGVQSVDIHAFNKL